MSVIVMGMEMPENCHVCGLCFGGLCFAISPEVYVMCPDEGRPNWCPLRPLPYVHGDLIDRDTIGGKFIPRQAYFTEEIKRKIGLIPSVVEAEGD